MLNWIYIDLNSYFASVEQQLNPKLRNKPLAVIPMMAETTSCIAASYEAKKFGIKTGTSVRDARLLCPKIQFVAAQHKNYIFYHNLIVDAVESAIHVSKICSIDEVACRITGRDQKLENAILIAHQIRENILKVGSELHCSIGIGPNQYLAKMATDMKKPKGLTILQLQDLPHVLYSLKLRDFLGVGEAMELRLKEYGIKTPQDLFSKSSLELKKVWGGIWGERFYKWIRGEDFEVLMESDKSLSHSHVLPPKLRTKDGAFGVGQKFVDKLGFKLRKKDLWVQTMAVSVRFVDKSRWATELRFIECQDTPTLMKIFREMWMSCPLKTPIKVRVVFFNLIHGSHRTLSFFDNEKPLKLSQALDKINYRYGHHTIYLGGLFGYQESAPMRIAFTQIPSLDDGD